MTPLQRWLIVGLIAACGIVSGAHGGRAQGFCGHRADFTKALNDKYQEVKTAAGVAGEFALIELYQSKSGATWTVLATDTQGKSCIIAAGKDWVEATPEISGEKL